MITRPDLLCMAESGRLNHACMNTVPAEAFIIKKNEPRHEIYNNVVCATSKASNQSAHTRSLIRAFASLLSIL